MYTASRLINSALEKALAITRQPMGNVQLIDWKLGYLELAAQRGFSPQFRERFRIVRKTDDCACGRAFRLRDTVVIDDVADDLQFVTFREAAREAGFRSVQSTPIISHSGAFVGMISTHGSHSPTSQQLQLIKELARETANELIWLRSHAGGASMLQKPTWPLSPQIYWPEDAGSSSTAAIAREAVARTTELLRQPKPDTFLGRSQSESIPLPDDDRSHS